MKKNYNLCWFYQNYTTLSKGGVGQPEAHVRRSVLTVLNKSKEVGLSVPLRYCVLGSKNRTTAHSVTSTTNLGQSIPLSQMSPVKLPPTWSILRYYLLKYRTYVRNGHHDSFQNVLESLCPYVFADVNSEIRVYSEEYVGVERRVSNSKWRCRLAQPGYRERGLHGLMPYNRPTISVNSSMPFHTSCHLPKSDDADIATCTVDQMTSEGDFTYTSEHVDRSVPRNTEVTDADVLTSSVLERNRTLADRISPVESIVSKGYEFAHPKKQSSNLVSEISHPLIKPIQEVRKVTIEERIDVSSLFPESENASGKGRDEPASSLKMNEMGTVEKEKKNIGKVLEDIDKVNTENGRSNSVWGKSAFLPPGNKKTAFHKNEDSSLLTKRIRKRNKEKVEQISEFEKNNDLPNIDRKGEVEKQQKEWDSMQVEERTSVCMEENLNYAGHVKSQPYDSNNDSDLFKMVEKIPSNIAETIAKYGIKSVIEGYTCLVARCPKLPRSRSKKASNSQPYGNLYINATSGHFQCDECQRYGTWSALQLNIENIKAIKKPSKLDYPCMAEVRGASLLTQGADEAEIYMNEGIQLNQLDTSDLELVLEKFGCDSLSLSTLRKYNVQYHSEDDALLLPFYLPGETLISTKKLTCQSQEYSDSCDVLQEFISPIGKSHLFGWNQISKDDDSIILTASEFDAMAIAQTTNYKALALPMGTSSIPIQSLPALERFKKILLWFENDLLSWKAAKAFARKLNDSRCFVIRPSVDNPGPYRALQEGLSLKKIIKNAHQIIHESIVGYSHMKSEVYSELANLKLVAGTEWKRYTPLNNILKGHRRGELTVVTGPTGSGKTTFMSEYSLDLCESGVRTLWGSFEIPNVKLAKVMLTQFAKKNLSSHLDEFDLWSKRFEHLPLFFMTFHGHQAIQTVIDAMTHAVYVHDIEHIIVDNLQFMMGAMDADKFYVQDRIISSFRNFATTLNCHITVVIHPRKEKEEELSAASVFGSAKATQEADNILILQDRRKSNPRASKYIQVVKNRFDGDLGKMLLKFDKESCSFANKELDSVMSNKPSRHQNRIVEEVSKISDDCSFQNRHSQDGNSIEQRGTNFLSEPEVKMFEYVSLNQTINPDEQETELADKINTAERLLY